MPKLSKSSASLLTWLYGAYLTGNRPVALNEASLVVPDLSESGLRSLLSQLRKRKWVTLDTVGVDRYLAITSYGISEIVAHFPALSDQIDTWEGEWKLLVFLTSPSFDPQFRFLRHFLLQYHFGQLSRGVYLYPFQLPPEVVHQLSFYPGSVVVVATKEWQVGDERSTMGSLFSLTDLCNSLSGISKEVNELLAINTGKKELMSQNRDSFYVVFDRLLSILEFDLGIHRRYFPQVKTSKALLCDLQQLFKL